MAKISTLKDRFRLSDSEKNTCVKKHSPSKIALACVLNYASSSVQVNSKLLSSFVVLNN